MTTSVILLEVSVLPATTAAGARALTSEPSGARTRTGTNAPPDAGMSGSVTQAHDEEARRAGHGERAVEVPRDCGAVPAKSISTSSPAIVTATRISRSPSTASITSAAS